MSKRILKDLQNAETLKDHGIYISYDDSDIRQISALILGPVDSVYEGGLMFFHIVLPEDYPFQPPKVKFLSYDGLTRFHPNLYIDGKVCLSILGTWSGPSWATTMSLSTVLLSIQGLLDSDPMKHEPGWEGDGTELVLKRKRYADFVKYRILAYSINLKTTITLSPYQSDFFGKVNLDTFWLRVKAIVEANKDFTEEVKGLPYGMSGVINWEKLVFKN